MSASSQRTLLVLIVGAALVLSVLGCGGGDSTARSSTGPRYLNDGDHEQSNDEDQDNNTADTDNDSWEDHLKTENNSYHDDDDMQIINYGHPADATAARTITALTRRYAAAAVVHNGALVCSMLTPQFAAAVPGDYGHSPGPPYLHGKTCAAVMSKMTRHAHAQLSTDFAVTGVRTSGNVVYALIGSSVLPASYLQLERMDGSWRVSSLLISPLP